MINKNKIDIQVNIHFKDDDVGWIIRGDSIEPLSTQGITRPRHLKFMFNVSQLIEEYIKEANSNGYS